MKKAYYIDYPQEAYEGQPHRYRCLHCKLETTKINGCLHGHLPTCDYRLGLEKLGYDADCDIDAVTMSCADEND